MSLMYKGVYTRNKRSPDQNGIKRNANESAPFEKMQVNMQFEERCLRDVDKKVSGGLRVRRVSPPETMVDDG